MIDPGWAAVIASFVSLTLGVVGIWLARLDSNRGLRRDDAKRRAEAYIEVLRIVETRGLVVQDQIWNYTDTQDPRWDIHVPRRKIIVPSRNDRAEARALLAAYGTREVRDLFEAWLKVVDAWDAKVVEWDFAAQYAERPELAPVDGEPERSNELRARRALGDVISREVAA
ncbi:hypothetical protein RWH45_10385 [Microbacterium sp. KSW4-17]|uniref:Secreted protein n=1 Tax=Microbacterium galbum TaxID=3075994 RepID=A0ABU3T8C9_9MICO|nr:hypothetical protein [Microbacterium sp. KSW4-17]MDU0367625.1 hypothetical protein [Microbacterium sp. KSW4-17]